MQRTNRPQWPINLITASEVAAFAFCHEQWRLEYGLGLPAANEVSRLAGTRHHERKTVAELVAGGWIAVGRFLAVLAAIVLGVLVLWVVWR